MKLKKSFLRTSIIPLKKMSHNFFKIWHFPIPSNSFTIPGFLS